MSKSSKTSQTQIPAVTKDISAMDTKIADSKDELNPEPAAEDAEPARGNWTGRFDFLLSLLGYSVGLGNVWRFPYLCYNNGGGAFLIPFTVMLIIAGLPLMFMELSFGQYAALGPVAVYNKFCPLFQGLGYGMVIVSSIVMLYYNLIIAWTIYYMAVSFMSIFYQLPWQNCDAEWSTEHCYSYEEADLCEAVNGTYYLRQCFNQTYAQLHNINALADVALRRPPAEEYFTNQVLGLSSGIEETGQIRWGMAVCLLAAWLIVFLCLCKGVQSSGKVVYFTALFPYVVLVILFFRGVTLPGASTGILFYLTPDFSQLLNAQVWGDAAVQIFFALSPAWGGLITLSSYNKFSNNCYIDSLIVAVSNILTSFFAGLVIFSVIGFLAHELNVEVDRVVDQGAGLAFIVYPEVVTRLPVSPLWSILFFVMLLTLGLDSQFALMETVTTAILDRFPNFRQKKVWVVLTVAVFGYLGGLIFTTNSGMYWLQLMDKYAANWSVLIIAIGECILIAWIYGAEKFCGDIQRMIGRQTKLWVFFWSAMWRIITPAALVFILVFNWIEYKPASYGYYVYPMWADAVGWILGVLPVIVVVLMAIDQICSGPDDLTIMEKARALSRPTEEWGPSATAVMRHETELSPPVLLLHGRPVLRERGA
ncbi:sodium- and chloride-dependent glycine transporter 1-like isoform X2 [Spodoptera litura]|uniref:Transporter n=1 Tax=Spodoptera litura TaxID=69820 RepID=A0A9J7EFP0_SPOLT|nr:sodium- and chloride-dependent glycine transporter 1-like isoform X2 [Spodoptera litura]